MTKDVRTKINEFRVALGRHFVDRQEHIDLLTVAAIAGEPVLLVGDPGTAKSDLANKFREALGVESYFEYLLTKFTEPSEILGAADISALRDGKFIRVTEGKLPDAKMAFLDEIFKANSAILNSMLGILNERKFSQNGASVRVPLEVLIAASNEISDSSDLSALRDRFTFKVLTESVQDGSMRQLLTTALQNHCHKEASSAPWKEGLATLEDIQEARRLVNDQIRKYDSSPVEADAYKFFHKDTFEIFQRVLKTLNKECGIKISDRKVIKVYRMLRTYAWLFHGGVVEKDDLQLLQYIGDSIEDLITLKEQVPRYLGISK